MPIYVYKCSLCGAERSVLCQLRSSNSEPAGNGAVIPPGAGVEECCGKLMVRQISVSAAHFKGSGFYATDYMNAGKTPTSGDGGDDPSVENKK